jgi:leader peptidase (prepilin peptidase)/N-methyltransferase
VIETLALAATMGLPGLCLGSYAATVALRAVRGEQSVWGRSRCDHCGVALGYLQTAPLLGYLRLGGVCATCGGRIDPLHPAGEIAGAAILIAAFAAAPPIHAAVLALLGLTLLAGAVARASSARLRRSPRGSRRAPDRGPRTCSRPPSPRCRRRRPTPSP